MAKFIIEDPVNNRVGQQEIPDADVETVIDRTIDQHVSVGCLILCGPEVDGFHIFKNKQWLGSFRQTNG